MKTSSLAPQKPSPQLEQSMRHVCAVSVVEQIPSPQLVQSGAQLVASSS
jgi:hypothetical protein